MKRRPFYSVIALIFGLSIAGGGLPAFAAETSFTVTETISYEDVLSGDEAADYDLNGDEGFATAPVARAEISAPAGIARAEVSAPTGVARFGPFVVINSHTVEVRGVIDSRAPDQFRRALAAFPGVKQLRMVECPGSEDDEANLALARQVRRAGINTHVPANGSIRSGGVELFLAGVKRTSEPGAQFGVHSWIDEDGREAKDYAANDPVHSEYISFYQDMGLQPERARAFYAFTNSVAPSSGVHYMTGSELARFGLTN
jgi:hypothetical protein